MKKAVNNTDMKIQKEAIEMMQECVTEFICFVTSDMVQNVKDGKRVALKG